MKENMLLEGVNGNFLSLSVCAVAWFSYYIIKNFSEGYMFLRPAIALWAVFAGEVIIRANFWYARHLINGGDANAFAPRSTQ